MYKMNTNYKGIITVSVLNTQLHHVGMSLIIETHEQLKYDMEKHNPGWITGDPWYNTYICKQLYGTLFEEFNRNARTDRCIIICSVDAHEKHLTSYVDNVISGGGNALPSNSTT